MKPGTKVRGKNDRGEELRSSYPKGWLLTEWGTINEGGGYRKWWYPTRRMALAALATLADEREWIIEVGVDGNPFTQSSAFGVLDGAKIHPTAGKSGSGERDHDIHTAHADRAARFAAHAWEKAKIAWRNGWEGEARGWEQTARNAEEESGMARAKS